MSQKIIQTKCPSEDIISEAEKGILEKKNQRTANALFVKDLEKLNEEELKLLPVKDFWDATKKAWKKNAFGTFAKRNSVTMKKIFGLAWTTFESLELQRKTIHYTCLNSSLNVFSTKL